MEWAAAVLPFPGERQCGDQFVACERRGGFLAAVIDGLGHGERAAAAALRAKSCIEEADTDDLVALVRACHERLKGTRGAVMTLALVGADAVRWLSVGNVEGALHGIGRKRDTVVQRSGVVGERLPTLLASQTTVVQGDLLLLASDGVLLPAGGPPYVGSVQAIADGLLAAHRRKNDDALVLVARHLGSGAGAPGASGAP